MSLGVVAYLNMLPFFGTPSETALFGSPVLLNGALERGEVRAGCISAIAGLKCGLHLVSPGFGVATSGAVGSVYLEPIVETSGDLGFWDETRVALVAAPLHQGPVPVWGRVLLLTTGESAQSLWLFRTLLRLAGVDSRVVAAGVQAAGWSLEMLAREASALRQGNEYACLLSIGDGALLRASRIAEHTLPLPRIDLGETWVRASGLPCVFAAWFAAPRMKPELVAPEVETLLGRWESSSREAQVAKVSAWNGTRQGQDEGGLSLAARMEYLDNIELRLGESHKETLECYRELARSVSLASA